MTRGGPGIPRKRREPQLQPITLLPTPAPMHTYRIQCQVQGESNIQAVVFEVNSSTTRKAIDTVLDWLDFNGVSHTGINILSFLV